MEVQYAPHNYPRIVCKYGMDLLQLNECQVAELLQSLTL